MSTAIFRGDYLFLDLQLRVLLVLKRTVAKADSIGLVVRMFTQCSAGKS